MRGATYHTSFPCSTLPTPTLPVRPLPIFALLALVTPVGADAQAFGMPSRLAEVELARSRACVGILEDVQALDAQMEPLARRSQRLEAMARAIALEDRTVIDTLQVEDPVLEQVRTWFRTDAALARRNANQPDASVRAERAAGRETIKGAVARAMETVQQEVTAAVEANEELLAAAAPCDGAIFVRSAVLEACDDATGVLCEQARLPASEVEGVRFVDDPEALWQIEQTRPWSTPTPLRRGQTGLDGARTIGFTRVGNVVASVAFSPLLVPRDRIPAETLAAYEATNDTLGISVEHATVTATPALAVRLALPEPLDREEGYILHFGSPEQADVVWAGEAGTGGSLEGTIPLAPSHVRRLVAGDALTVTALAPPETEDGAPDAVYAIGIGSVSQAQTTGAILQYMATQLEDDLNRLVAGSGAS